MVSRAVRYRYTYEDYLHLERDANVRHEFYDGEIYAMAGGSPVHAAVAVNVSTLLRTQLRGRGCSTYSSDLRIRVAATGLATYPDITVVCGPLEIDAGDRHTVTNPVLLVEVLSPSSAAYDRGDKLENYEQIPSLREVVLVAHDERLIEVWRRAEGGVWSRREARIGSLELTSVPCALPVDEVYRDETAP